MTPEGNEGLDFASSHAAPGIRLWRYAAILGVAGLEGIDLLWDLRPPSDEALAALSQAVDRYMRSAAFLDLMRYSLKMMSIPIYFGSPNSPMGRRISP
jgi:hypothetical protein